MIYDKQQEAEDRLEEIEADLNEHLKKAGFSSLRDIVIRGPVEVSRRARLGLEEASAVCSKASIVLERFGAISTSQKEYISTGSKELDKLFGGNGIETGAITEFYGHSGSGKTQVCHTLCITLQQLHPDYKAIYIDTEGKFRPERISQIAHRRDGDAGRSLRNIKRSRPLNSARLETMIELDCISEIAKDSNVKLLVVDSVTGLYRAEYGERSMLSQRQHHLLKLMKTLQNIAHVYNIAVVVTNQILTEQCESGISSTIPVGGNVMAHSSTFRIQLFGLSPDRTRAKLITSPCYPQQDINFLIDDEGVTDLDGE